MTTTLIDRSVRLAAQDGTTFRCVINEDGTATINFTPSDRRGKYCLSHADLADVRDLIADVIADAAAVDPANPPPAGARVPQ